MKKTIFWILALTFFCCMQACSDPQIANKYDNETTVDAIGRSFLDNATEAGHTEVKASYLAETISKNPRVTGFAKMMVTDHSSILNHLIKLKTKELVNAQDPVNEKHGKLIDSLSKLTGADFDKGYMNMMVNDHEKAVDLFKNASDDRAAVIQDYARKTLPTIEMHLDSAKAIFASLK